jgi:Protein of unknown function (DUF3108)
MGHRKSMSHRLTIVIGIFCALALAAGAFYFLHGAGEIRTPAEAAPLTAPSAAAEAPPRPPAGPVTRKKSTAAASAAASEAETVFPRPGEVLEFTADVSSLSNVANLRLAVAGPNSFLGRPAFHLQAIAHTENPLRMVFQLDDQFDSYSDAGTMSSLQYEMHLNERGQKVESVQRMSASGKDPATAEVTQARVTPGTRDPLGMMEFLRSVDWSKTHQVRSPVYDGHKLYDVVATFAGNGETVSVPAGKFASSKVDLKVFDDGAEMKDARFTLFLANNAGRTPILLEAVLPFATARVQLKSAR